MNLFQKTASTIFATSLIASAAQAQFSDDEIRIGYLADMSGTYRDLSGPGGLEALKMAVEDFGGQPPCLAHAFEPFGSVELDGAVADDGLGAGNGLVFGHGPHIASAKRKCDPRRYFAALKAVR